MDPTTTTDSTKLHTAETLLTNLTSISPTTFTSALTRLHHLTKTDPTYHPILSTLHNGALLSVLSSLLLSPSPSTQLLSSSSLLNLSLTPSLKPLLSSHPSLLPSLSHSLSLHRSSSSSPSSIQSSSATIYSLSLDPTLRSTLCSHRDLVYYLIDIVSYPNSPSQSIKDSLRALFSLSLHPPNRPILLSLDALPALMGRLGSGRLGMLEDVTAVIAQLAGCDEGVSEFGRVRGVRVLVDLIDLGETVTVRVRENAVSALLKLVEFGGDPVAGEIRGVGLGLVFDGLAEVVHCGSDKGKLRAQALMRLLENGMSCCGVSSSDFERIEGDYGSGPLSESSSSRSY